MELLFQLLLLQLLQELLDLPQADTLQVVAVDQVLNQDLVDLVAVELGDLRRQDRLELPTLVVEAEVLRHQWAL